MKTHFQTPQEIGQQVWKELGRACQDRHHAWRTPVLATSTGQGLVNARTVVLRKVDVTAAKLEIYTDGRSPKVFELINQPSAIFVFWSDRLSWQLRVKVEIAVQTTGPYVESMWQIVKQTSSANDYMGTTAPGAVLQQDGVLPEASTQDTHFAVLTAQVTEMDWLELARDGHRRARMVNSQWEWLKP